MGVGEAGIYKTNRSSSIRSGSRGKTGKTSSGGNVGLPKQDKEKNKNYGGTRVRTRMTKRVR